MLPIEGELRAQRFQRGKALLRAQKRNQLDLRALVIEIAGEVQERLASIVGIPSGAVGCEPILTMQGMRSP